MINEKDVGNDKPYKPPSTQTVTFDAWLATRVEAPAQVIVEAPAVGATSSEPLRTAT